ncbi:MAG: VaFE repeat-containing surface-anchored protein [Lachnospiraceae bacterium]|nr:VaFE repeat-containing surface-anchored protein [Lachnospiraceae bacterium]
MKTKKTRKITGLFLALLMVLTLLPMTALADDTVPEEGKEGTALEEGAGTTAPETEEEMTEIIKDGPYRITFDSNGNGTVGLENYGNGELAFDAGMSLQAVAFPEEGFHLEDLSIIDREGNVLEDAAMPAQNLRFAMPETDITVKAVFAEDSYEGIGWRQQAAQERFYLGKEGSLIGKRYQGESAAMLEAMLEDGTIEDGRDFFSLTIFKNYTVSDVLGFTESYGTDIDGLAALAEEGGYSFFREFVTGRKLLTSSGPMNITKVSKYEDIWYGGWFEGSRFTITGPSGTYKAYCTQHDKLALPTNTTISYTYENTNANMVKLLYYGLYGLGYDSSIYTAVYNEYGTWDENLMFIYTARLMSDFRTPGSAGMDWDPGFIGLKETVLAKPAPPAGFKTYIAGTSDNSLQEIIFGTLAEGKLSFNKKANPATCGYSLQGAIYRVYKGTSISGTFQGWFITDASGKGYVVERINGSDLASATSTEDDGKFLKGITTKEGKTYDFGRYSSGKDYIYCKTSATEMKLDAGSYFLEEYLAPSNGKFYINTTGKGVNVTAGKTTAATDTDIPKMDPVGILLTKKPVEGTGAVPSLADAQFTLEFYEDTVAASAEDLEGKTPTRTWVYKTDEDGYLNIKSSSLKVSGDELYYDQSNRPSLPSGTVVINETLAPKGYFVNESTYIATLVILENPTQKGTFHCYEQKEGSDTWIDLGTQMVDVTQESDLEANIDELLTPTIATEAIDNLTGTHVGVVGKNDTITDTVQITNAFPEKEYTLTAQLIDKESRDVLTTVTKDSKAPKSSDTYIDYEVTMPAMKFDSSALSGKTVVVYETMSYKGSEEILVEHADLLDANQSIFYPGVGTEAVDSETKIHTGFVGEDSAIIDSVKCTNLVKNQEYILKGKLVYKNDFTDKNGTKHKAGDAVAVKDTSETEKTFTAKGLAEETVELTYYVDSTVLQGANVVVFEDLYVNDTKVASHADLFDEKQTIHYPSLQTILTEKDSDNKRLLPTKEIHLTDTVSYTNLLPGETYTLTGWLMNKNSGERLMTEDVEEVPSVTKELIPEESCGTETMEFTFNGKDLNGADLVAFEVLTWNDMVIVEHSDLGDLSQTVSIYEEPPEPPSETPTTPDPPTPQPETGDTNNWTLFLATIITSLTLLAAAIVFIIKKHS